MVYAGFGKIDPLDQLVAMIRFMGKEPDMEALEDVARVKVNQQTDLKESPGPPRETLNEMHLRFQDALRERGFVPILPG